MADWFTIFAVLGPLLGVFVPLIIHLNNRMDKKFEILMARMDANKKDIDQKIESTQKTLEQKIEHIDQKIDSNQKETNARFEGLNTRFNSMENRMTSMESEIKNTNQRLTDFKTDMNQRLSTIENFLLPKKIFRFEEPHHDPDEPKEN